MRLGRRLGSWPLQWGDTRTGSVFFCIEPCRLTPSYTSRMLCSVIRSCRNGYRETEPDRLRS